MGYMARQGARSAAARHFCRFDGCSFVVEPQDGAHAIVALHRFREHLSKTPKICHAECGFRARPYEGRYTTREQRTTKRDE